MYKGVINNDIPMDIPFIDLDNKMIAKLEVEAMSNTAIHETIADVMIIGFRPNECANCPPIMEPIIAKKFAEAIINSICVLLMFRSC